MNVISWGDVFCPSWPVLLGMFVYVSAYNMKVTLYPFLRIYHLGGVQQVLPL